MFVFTSGILERAEHKIVYFYLLENRLPIINPATAYVWWRLW